MTSNFPIGIRRVISGLFDGDDLNKFESAFAIGSEANQFDSRLSRPPLADFNSRPARLIELMVLEAGFEDLHSLCAAALCEIAPEKIPEEFSIERQIVADAQAAAKPSANSEAISLVRLLDDVRHAHMLPEYSDSVRLEFTLTVRDALARITYPSSAKLKTKLNAWLARFGQH